MAVRYRQFQGKSVSQRWLDVLAAATRDGVRIRLHSGHRTMAEQQALFNQNMIRPGVPKVGHALTAVPTSTAPHIRVGRADHALDIECDDIAGFFAWLRAHGTHPALTVRGECWHMELPRDQLKTLSAHLNKKAKPVPKAKVPHGSRYMVDLSSNNPEFDAHAYRKAGHRVVALKATEGETFTDPDYGARVKAAHAAGLKVVHYLFCRPDNHSNPAGEVHHFLTVIRRHLKKGDRVCLDVEKGSPTQAYVDEAARLVVIGLKGTKVTKAGWLYSYTGFLNDHKLRAPKGWRLWLADYRMLPKVLASGLGRPRSIHAHQFTDGQQGHAPRKLAGTGGHTSDVSKLSRKAVLGFWLS